jgi:hypothetical protein
MTAVSRRRATEVVRDVEISSWGWRQRARRVRRGRGPRVRLVEIVSALDADPLLPSSRMVGGSWIGSAGPVSPSTRLFCARCSRGRHRRSRPADGPGAIAGRNLDEVAAHWAQVRPKVLLIGRRDTGEQPQRHGGDHARSPATADHPGQRRARVLEPWNSDRSTTGSKTASAPTSSSAGSRCSWSASSRPPPAAPGTDSRGPARTARRHIRRPGRHVPAAHRAHHRPARHPQQAGIDPRNKIIELGPSPARPDQHEHHRLDTRLSRRLPTSPQVKPQLPCPAPTSAAEPGLQDDREGTTPPPWSSRGFKHCSLGGPLHQYQQLARRA